MAIKLLWYLTAPDGTVPWEEHGRWDTGFDHLQQLAAAIDKLGYYGALLATGYGGNDVLTVAAATLSSSNRAKTLTAPLVAVVAWDSRFHDHLPTQFPAYDAKSFFDANPVWIERAGVSNAFLQAAYLIVTARALGLDAGPMTGFTPDLLDAEFFPDGGWRSLLVINLGYGIHDGLPERGPRLAFGDAVRVL